MAYVSMYIDKYIVYMSFRVYCIRTNFEKYLEYLKKKNVLCFRNFISNILYKYLKFPFCANISVVLDFVNLFILLFHISPAVKICVSLLHISLSHKILTFPSQCSLFFFKFSHFSLQLVGIQLFFFHFLTTVNRK